MDKQRLEDFYNYIILQDKEQWTYDEIKKIGEDNNFIQDENDMIESLSYFSENGLIKEETINKKGKMDETTKTLNQSAVTLYLHDIGNISILTPDEEKEIAEKAYSGDIDAQNELCSHNLKLVVSVAKHYTNFNISFEDLIQEGNIGLIKASERFNPELGFRFTTYATWWIRQSIERSIADFSRIIRIPVHSHELMRKIDTIIGLYYQEHMEYPSDEYVAKKMNISVEKLQWFKKKSQGVLSLNRKVGDDQEIELGDVIADEEQERGINNIADDIADKETVKTLFAALSIRELAIIKKRFGFYDGRIYTLNEIGIELNVTRERVRQIEIRALRKMRKAYIKNNGDTSDYESRSSKEFRSRMMQYLSSSYSNYRFFSNYVNLSLEDKEEIYRQHPTFDNYPTHIKEMIIQNYVNQTIKVLKKN